MTTKHALRALMGACLLALAPLLAACSETDEDTTIEWTDWAIRNEAYFLEQMATARAAIAQAQATYGDQWEAHCDWRVYKRPPALAQATGKLVTRLLDAFTSSW